MTEEGRKAVNFVEECGFNPMSYTAQQAKTISIAVKAMNDGLVKREIVETLLSPIKEKDGLTVFQLLQKQEEAMLKYIEHSQNILNLLGNLNHEVFLARTSMENEREVYYNLLGNAILVGTPGDGCVKITLLDKMALVGVLVADGWEKADKMAADLVRKKMKTA